MTPASARSIPSCAPGRSSASAASPSFPSGTTTQRALLIARYYHIDAIAYAADDVPFREAVRTHLHEWLAQVAVILDLYVLHTGPEHLAARHR